MTLGNFTKIVIVNGGGVELPKTATSLVHQAKAMSIAVIASTMLENMDTQVSI